MHQRFGPVHIIDPRYRHEYLLARPPIHRIHGHIADSPSLGVDDEVLDVANLSIAGLDVVAKHVPGAMQVRIALHLLWELIGFGHGEPAWVSSGGMRPQGNASRPIGRPVIIGV